MKNLSSIHIKVFRIIVGVTCSRLSVKWIEPVTSEVWDRKREFSLPDPHSSRDAGTEAGSGVELTFEALLRATGFHPYIYPERIRWRLL